MAKQAGKPRSYAISKLPRTDLITSGNFKNYLAFLGLKGGFKAGPFQKGLKVDKFHNKIINYDLFNIV